MNVITQTQKNLRFSHCAIYTIDRSYSHQPRSTNLFFHSLRFHPPYSTIPHSFYFISSSYYPQYSSSSNPSLQISPSEMNEGSTLERGGNSAKFILSPILLIPRVIGRVRETSTTETDILYIYIFVSWRVYNIIEFSFSRRV